MARNCRGAAQEYSSCGGKWEKDQPQRGERAVATQSRPRHLYGNVGIRSAPQVTEAAVEAAAHTGKCAGALQSETPRFQGMKSACPFNSAFVWTSPLATWIT